MKLHILYDVVFPQVLNYVLRVPPSGNGKELGIDLGD